jgi:hypothetical protein
MNLSVLETVDVTPRHHEVACLRGYDILIRPLANLVRSDADCVFGIVATTTHDDLGRLYNHARNVLGAVYLPEAVVAETADGTLKPALCYVAPTLEAKRAAASYVDRIIEPAREYGFPDWYLQKLESFRV